MKKSQKLIWLLQIGWVAAINVSGHVDGAHEADHVEPYPVALEHAPTPVPDRIILTWNGDPATSQAVTWRTDAGGRPAYGEVAVATGHANTLEFARVVAETQLLETDLGLAAYHSATFSGLEPDTLYAYRVGDGVNWSEVFQFRTASREAKPFSFIYFGDSQNHHKMHWSRVFRKAFRDSPGAAFTLHAGDLINNHRRDAEWGEWHGVPGWVNGMIPVIATPGNHDYLRDDPENLQVCANWRPQFAYPIQDPPDGLEETCYYIDYQGARIISLDSMHKKADQVAWLESVLEDNPQKWTIITFHHPFYSPGRQKDQNELLDLWKPVFDAFKVDLVLTGHDHAYSRTGDKSALPGGENIPEGRARAYDPEIGTVHVVSVSGPKTYEVKKDDFAVRSLDGVQLYQVIEVDGDVLRYKACDPTGTLHDAFRLEKRPGMANRLVEELPAGAGR